MPEKSNLCNTTLPKGKWVLMDAGENPAYFTYMKHFPNVNAIGVIHAETEEGKPKIYYIKEDTYDCKDLHINNTENKRIVEDYFPDPDRPLKSEDIAVSFFQYGKPGYEPLQHTGSYSWNKFLKEFNLTKNSFGEPRA